MYKKITTVFFCILFFIFSLGQHQRISFFHQLINGYVYEFFIVIYIVAYSLRYRHEIIPRLQSWKQTITKDPLVALSLSLVCWIAVGYFVSVGNYNFVQNGTGILYSFRLLLYLLLAYVVSRSFKPAIKKGFYLFAWSSLILTVAQLLLLPSLQDFYNRGWDVHLYRVFGVWFDTTTAAVLFGLTLIVLVRSFKMPHFKAIREHVLHFTLICSFIIMIILTYSRSVYLGLLVVLWYILLKKVGIIRLTVVTICLITALWLIPRPHGEGAHLERTSTIVTRVEDMKEGLALWARHPLFGVGYNRIRFNRKITPDTIQQEAIAGLSHSASNFSSVYVTLLASTGIIGFGLFWGLLWQVWKKGNNNQKALLLFLLIVSIFDPILLINFVMFLSIICWKLLESDTG